MNPILSKQQKFSQERIQLFFVSRNFFWGKFLHFSEFEKDLETGHIDKLALYLRNVQTAYERNGLF